jgi:hypothetical protein
MDASTVTRVRGKYGQGDTFYWMYLDKTAHHRADARIITSFLESNFFCTKVRTSSYPDLLQLYGSGTGAGVETKSCPWMAGSCVLSS